MMFGVHSLGIGYCWLNQLPRLTHMPKIRELLTELDISMNYIVYESAVFGHQAEEPKSAEPRRDIINII
jgi:hypothetical protein